MKSGWDNGLRVVALLGVLFGAGSLFAQAIPPQVTEPVAGAKLVAVRVVREDGSVLVAAPTGLVMEVGKPLLPEQVAASLRLLYQTGDYADLRAVIYPEPGGVR